MLRAKGFSICNISPNAVITTNCELLLGMSGLKLWLASLGILLCIFALYITGVILSLSCIATYILESLSRLPSYYAFERQIRNVLVLLLKFLSHYFVPKKTACHTF